MLALYPRVTCYFTQCAQYSHIHITGVPLAPLNDSFSMRFEYWNIGMHAKPLMITCVKRHLIVYLPCWLALPVMAVGSSVSSDGRRQQGWHHADDVRHARHAGSTLSAEA